MRRRSLLAAVLLTAVLAGCAGEDPGADPNNPNQVEIMTSWATGAEQTSLYELIAVFESQHPDIDVIDASVSGADATLAAIATRLATGNPPDIILTAAGAALREQVAAGHLQNLERIAGATGWIDECRPELAAVLSTDGIAFAAPAGVHRGGMVWADTGVLDSAGVDPSSVPATIDAWIADLERVRASGVPFPLALGGPRTQLELFESVLLADLGVVGYQALWTNAATWEPHRLRLAVAHYARLLEFADPSAGSLSWDDAVKRVTSGKAGYIVASDAAYAVFRGAGFELGNQYAAFPTPGTAGAFIVQADAFAVPVGAAHDAGARAWLATVTSPAGQAAFGAVKGSIPTASGTDPADFDAYQATAIEALARDTLVVSLSAGAAGSPAWMMALSDAVAEFGVGARPEALVNALIAAAEAELG